MRAGVVFDLILDELESRNASAVKREMIRATSVAHGDSGHAQVFEGLHPFHKNRRDSLVFLKVNAANLPRAVIEIEIDRNLGLFRFELERPCEPAHVFRKLDFVWILRTHREMFFHIPARTKKSLFFTAPQS